MGKMEKGDEESQTTPEIEKIKNILN